MKPEVMTSTSYDGKHTLEYIDSKHLYRMDGEPADGVTTVIKKSMPPSPGLLRWMISQGVKEHKEQKKLKRAGDIGTIVHDYAYNIRMKREYDMAPVYAHPERETILNCFAQVLDFSNAHTDEEIVLAEAIVGSPTHGFAGTLDELYRKDGKLILRDYKTSSGIYEDMFIQMGAYRIGLKEWYGIEIDGAEIVRFGKEDDKADVELITDPEQLAHFSEQYLNCLKTHRFLKVYRTKFDERYQALRVR